MKKPKTRAQWANRLALIADLLNQTDNQLQEKDAIAIVGEANALKLSNKLQDAWSAIVDTNPDVRFG